MPVGLVFSRVPYVECRPFKRDLVNFTEERAFGSKDNIGRGVVDLEDRSFHYLTDTPFSWYFHLFHLSSFFEPT
jgi:hypothetical protein